MCVLGSGEVGPTHESSCPSFWFVCASALSLHTYSLLLPSFVVWARRQLTRFVRCALFDPLGAAMAAVPVGAVLHHRRVMVRIVAIRFRQLDCISNTLLSVQSSTPVSLQILWQF